MNSNQDEPVELDSVFGYGSLIWRPGFPFVSRERAYLPGFARRFCRLSVRHRGSPESPGMVVGLMPGPGCEGVVYGIDSANRRAALEYLDEREGPGYARTRLQVSLAANQAHRMAWVYLPDPDHETYAPDLPLETRIDLIAWAQGESGRAIDYLEDLVLHLREFGTPDPLLEDMLLRVRERRADTESG